MSNSNWTWRDYVWVRFIETREITAVLQTVSKKCISVDYFDLHTRLQLWKEKTTTLVSSFPQIQINRQKSWHLKTKSLTCLFAALKTRRSVLCLDLSWHCSAWRCCCLAKRSSQLKRKWRELFGGEVPIMPPTRYATDPSCRRPAMLPTRRAADPLCRRPPLCTSLPAPPREVISTGLVFMIFEVTTNNKYTIQNKLRTNFENALTF